MIQFLMNNTLVSETALDPNLTVLNYLRQNKRRCGTKEGCASGDCGACTVTLGRVENGEMVYETANSCLLLVSSLQGKQLITVEDLKQGNRLHPVQQAMVDCHASQCGFCTPGFVMSLFTLQKNNPGWQRHAAEQALAGNLCRCTGYRPIIDAARQACEQPQPDSFTEQAASTVARLQQLHNNEIQRLTLNDRCCMIPKTCDQLAELLVDNPDAVLLAGGTDLALHITQRFTPLPLLIALEQIEELKHCQVTDTQIVLGAGASLHRCYALLSDEIPAFAHILERFASLQIRHQGTLGGNIANGSPIGDSPPMLLALNASVVLQKGNVRREIPLDSFFTGYRQTALQQGEFIRQIVIPKVTGSQKFYAWKVAKRLEDDISAVFCAMLSEVNDDGVLSTVRIAYGGMAAVPKRAIHSEQELQDKPFTPTTLENACKALAQDFTPLSDARASGEYRLRVAQNLLRRTFAAQSDELKVLEVSRYVS